MKPFTLLPTLACLILIVAHRVRAFSSGAPEESCDSLLVNHTHVGNPVNGVVCDATCRQARQLRWIGNSSADSFIYNCNETYQLQLTTTADVSLNGYMVAPRDDTGTTPDESVPYVGSWESGTGVKLLCNGSAVTQSSALVATTTVTMTWKAPMYGFQSVAFWFVIVPSTAFYYLPVKSLTAIPNTDQCTCPPGQCAMTVNSMDTICVEPSNSLCSAGQMFNEEMCQCEACSRTCQNGGTLNETTCTCDCAGGFSGDNCGTCAVMCQNGGTRNETTCTCDCADGYSGDTCENCLLTCMNGGTRNETTCTCDCADSHSGDTCEICKSRHCQNGGVLNVDTCTCDCGDGYSGDSCGICSRVCQNGGTLDAESCMCDCSGGFGSRNCETCALMCQNGGTLNDTTCTCDCADGYSGDTCGNTLPVNEGVFGTEQFIGIVAGVAALIFVVITIVTISTVAFCCCCLRRVKHSQK